MIRNGSQRHWSVHLLAMVRALLHIARAVRRNMAAWRAVASVSVPALGKLLRNRVR